MSLLGQMNLNAGQAVELYIKLRDAKKAKDEAHKNDCARIVAAMEKMEGALLECLDETGAQNIASAAGTVYKSTQISATVADKDAFMAFVKETDQYEALDIKANKTFVKDYLDENQEAPPGVKVSQVATVGVQRR